MKVVVFAYHNMGIAGVEALFHHGFDIQAVFTHEDDPGENCWFGSVKNWAIQKNIPVYSTEEVNSPKWIATIAAIKPDIIISIYYRKMICQEILDLPRIGAFNLHGSLLPNYRGRCPVNWVIIKGEKKTGVTLHYMVEKPDAGDIVSQKAVTIDTVDTAKTLYDKLCGAAKELLDELLPLIKQGQIPRQKQDLKAGSYYGGRRQEDGRIDWKMTAGDIYNLIRGVTRPYPGAYALTENNEKVIIWWGETKESNKINSAGSIEIDSQDVLVQTGKNAIRLLEIEILGKCYTDSQIIEYFHQGKVTRLI